MEPYVKANSLAKFADVLAGIGGALIGVGLVLTWILFIDLNASAFSPSEQQTVLAGALTLSLILISSIPGLVFVVFFLRWMATVNLQLAVLNTNLLDMKKQRTENSASDV